MWSRLPSRPALLRVGILGAALLWSYWPTLASMARTWTGDPQYSHGYLVPLFAVVLLWWRGREVDFAALRPSAWGYAVLAAGTLLRLGGAFFYYEWFDALSLLPVLAGLFLLLGGWRGLRWAWPAIGFLVFMIPLPHFAAFALAWPLQRTATAASTYALQTLGYAAMAEGNVIVLGELRLGVVEACSGLSMLMVFFALAFAMALVVSRPLWQRAVIVASAVPIALASNVLRITATGVLFMTAGRGAADLFYHDLAGWFMMPVALALLWLELLYLARLVVPLPPAPESPRPYTPTRAAPLPAPG
jgi:exosortase